MNETLILESTTETENVATRDNDGTLNERSSRRDSIAEREEEKKDGDVEDDGRDGGADDVEPGDKAETRIAEDAMRVSSEDVKRDGRILEPNFSPKSATEFPTMTPSKEEIDRRKREELRRLTFRDERGR